jgi:hypothetical protein
MKNTIEYFKTLGVDPNTTATIFITVLTFSLGYLISWIAIGIKKSKEKSSYKKSLLLILKDFSKACEKQESVVINSLKGTNLKYGNDFVIRFIPIATIDYLCKLDFNTFIQNIEPLIPKNNFSKAISKLFELIFQIKILNESISDFLKMNFDIYRKYEMEYQDNLFILKQIHDELGMELDGKPIDIEIDGKLIQEYFEIFGFWQRDGMKVDTVSTYNEVICKILAMVRNNKGFPIGLRISQHALKCELAFKNIEKIDGLLKNKIIKFAYYHRRAYRLLRVIIKILN